jgi:hypothetical protein
LDGRTPEPDDYYFVLLPGGHETQSAGNRGARADSRDHRNHRAPAVARAVVAGGSRIPGREAKSHPEVAFLAERRKVIRDVLKNRYGIDRLPASKAELPVLQNLVDDGVFGPEQDYEWRCFGVALGDVVAAEFGLEWIARCDERGAEPALRLSGTSFLVFPQTMLLEPLERNESIDLLHLVDCLQESIREQHPKVS